MNRYAPISRSALVATLPQSQSIILKLLNEGWKLRDEYGARFYLVQRRKRLPVREATVMTLYKKGLITKGKVVGEVVTWKIKPYTEDPCLQKLN